MALARSTGSRTRYVRGAITCLAMFALGGLLLWGLIRAPRSTAPRSPDLPWGTPARTLRLATLDCGGTGGRPDVAGLAAGVRRHDPDFVFLQQVRSEDVLTFVEGLGMQQSFHPQLFQRLGRDPRATSGCLVLSKHPLFEGEPLRTPGSDGKAFGARAVSIVDGVKFAVASVKLIGGDDRGIAAAGSATPAEFAAAWVAAGSPPAVAGVAMNARDADEELATAKWYDLLEPARPPDVRPRPNAMLAYGDWGGAHPTILPANQGDLLLSLVDAGHGRARAETATPGTGVTTSVAPAERPTLR